MRDTARPGNGHMMPVVGPGEFEPFLTAREVAERLRIAPCTVLRYYEDGVLPGRRLRAARAFGGLVGADGVRHLVV